MVNRVRDLLLRARVEIIYRAVLLFLKIPDAPMAALARWSYVAALPFVENEEDLLQVQEWEKIFRAGPPLSDAVRRLLRDARARQVKLTLRGLLIHHAAALRSSTRRE
jgi:hypothetical protein